MNTVVVGTRVSTPEGEGVVSRRYTEGDTEMVEVCYDGEIEWAGTDRLDWTLADVREASGGGLR